ncbi:outer membrane protein [Aestuariibius sp. 2305UL40-4]|uniref:outer membrane protein n=1 Tax=Aestuariibius violaceus TaxID=3234132 RepID=UPI00348DF53A
MTKTQSPMLRHLLAATSVLLPLQAAAQDADWSGAFVGGSVGIGAFESDLGLFQNESTDGVFNLQGGYNWQTGNFVYGVVASVGASNFDEGFDASLIEDLAFIDCNASTGIDAMASLRGRAGLAVGNSLFYGTAGVALLDVDQNLECGEGGGGESFSLIDYDEREDALVVGFGLESMISDNLSLTAEYLTYRIDVDTDGEGFDLGDINTDIGADTITIGLNYHFF